MEDSGIRTAESTADAVIETVEAANDAAAEGAATNAGDAANSPELVVSQAAVEEKDPLADDGAEETTENLDEDGNLLDHIRIRQCLQTIHDKEMELHALTTVKYIFLWTANNFFFIISYWFYFQRDNGEDKDGVIFLKKNDLLNEISQAIDDLSNLKTLHQLRKETLMAQESSKEMEKRAKEQEYRLEQANLRMQAIEAEEKEKCRKTAALMKEFEANCGSSPFFQSLQDILNNFLSKFLFLY